MPINSDSAQIQQICLQTTLLCVERLLWADTHTSTRSSLWLMGGLIRNMADDDDVKCSLLEARNMYTVGLLQKPRYYPHVLITFC